MNRKKIYEEVEEVIVSYCQDCFLQKQFRKDKGRSYAHKFCISQCTVGEKLRELGNKLVDDTQV
ncbi:zinc-finger domain-containing protein [Peribacillus sp. NPDC097264]|uniref:zinc-finger domain-containing protein n=1 Tax=unclassified Peribacillus TaxID=2675266 RepID=UPI0037F850D2